MKITISMSVEKTDADRFRNIIYKLSQEKNRKISQSEIFKKMIDSFEDKDNETT